MAALGAVWPALALAVLAGGVAALLLRLGLHRVSLVRPGRDRSARRRFVDGLVAGAMCSAAAGVLLAPVAAGWAAGVLVAALLAMACAAVLAASVRRGHRRAVPALVAALGLGALALPVLVPSAAVALATATVVMALALAGTSMLAGPRLLRRVTEPG